MIMLFASEISWLIMRIDPPTHLKKPFLVFGGFYLFLLHWLYALFMPSNLNSFVGGSYSWLKKKMLHLLFLSICRDFCLAACCHIRHTPGCAWQPFLFILEEQHCCNWWWRCAWLLFVWRSHPWYRFYTFSGESTLIEIMPFFIIEKCVGHVVWNTDLSW